MKAYFLRVFLFSLGSMFHRTKSEYGIDFEFDTELLDALILPSGLGSYSVDFKNQIYDGSTETLENMLIETREYLETIPLTNTLLNNLSVTDGEFSNADIKRMTHWLYVYETISQWSKQKTSEYLLEWVHFVDKNLENFCDSIFITPLSTNEFEQEFGADETSCLKKVLEDFPYMKYLGVRAAYVKMLESDVASDLSDLLTQNTYEAVYTDYEKGALNAINGDRLIKMNSGLPLYGGRNCSSQSCAKSLEDEENCASSEDLDHVQRNCTFSQKFVDYYTEWNINFVLSGNTKYQDSAVTVLLYRSILEDPSAWVFERAQSLYFLVITSITKIFLNPVKSREYIPLDKVDAHAENLLNAWVEVEPNLTSWSDLNNPPKNGIDPANDVANAEVGDWMDYLNDLYGGSSPSSFISQIITFLRTRVLFGIFISPDVV